MNERQQAFKECADHCMQYKKLVSLAGDKLCAKNEAAILSMGLDHVINWARAKSEEVAR